MKLCRKLIPIVPVLIIFVSTAYAQTDAKKHVKEAAPTLPASSIKSTSERPNPDRSNQKQTVSSQKQKQSDEGPGSGQTFTGSGPAMARENPDS